MSATATPDLSAAVLRRVWHELEARGYDPKGREHDFRARCPGHDGETWGTLRVSTTIDGAARLHCYAHDCDLRSMLEPLGMRPRELFPAGHRDAESRPLPDSEPTRGPSFRLARILKGLDDLREPWRAQVFCRCQFCGEDGGWLTIGPAREVIDFFCPAGCSTRAFTQGLSGRVALEAEKPKRRRRGRS